jgi:hypothetical protein
VTAEQEPESQRSVGLSIDPDPQRWRGLVLKLGTSRFPCALDLDHPDFAVGSGKLASLFTLDCWISELDRLSRGAGPMLLPFDFSDQCTGWLRVTAIDEGLAEVQAGWSLVGQYALTPRDLVGAYERGVDFEPVRNAKIVRPLTDVIAAVHAARAAVADREWFG